MKRAWIGTIGVVALFWASTLAQAFYNASTGRWLSRDPIGEAGFAAPVYESANDQSHGVSLYGYVGNNSANNIDALGLLKFKGCSDYQKGQLEGNLRQFCSLVKNKNNDIACCLGKPGLANCLKRKCDDLENITFICEPRESGRCKTSKPGRIVCAWTKPWGNTIHICPGFWGACNNSDSDWGCILIHEIAHTCMRTETTARSVERCLGCPRAIR